MRHLGDAAATQTPPFCLRSLQNSKMRCQEHESWLESTALRMSSDGTGSRFVGTYPASSSRNWKERGRLWVCREGIPTSTYRVTRMSRRTDSGCSCGGSACRSIRCSVTSA
jgi:hypothetical protein